MTNTLNSLRSNQSLMLPGVPFLLDDIGGDDHDEQFIYSSISMRKAILQVKVATQNQARSDDLTMNRETLKEWIQPMFTRARENHKHFNEASHNGGVDHQGIPLRSESGHVQFAELFPEADVSGIC